MRSITKISIICASYLLLWYEPAAPPQELLRPNHKVARSIEPGGTHTFSVKLNDGDYLSGSITQRGRVDVTILHPDRSVHRRLLGEAAKRPFAFAAEGSGVYAITTSNATSSPAQYELVVERRLSLNERLRSAPRTDPYSSPRIQALRRQIASQRPDTEAFWEQVARQGTPLVEPFTTTVMLVHSALLRSRRHWPRIKSPFVTHWKSSFFKTKRAG